MADGAQSHKRHREEPKDWRDVHLGSSRKGSGPPSSHGRGRAESLEGSKRGSRSRRERDDHRRSDYRERDRERDRDRERERDRGKRDDKERHHKEEKNHGQPAQAEEREEGE